MPHSSSNGQRLGFVTLGSNVPSTRFRFYPFRRPLEQLGHSVRMWTSIPSVYDYWKSIGWRMSYQAKKAIRTAQWLDALRFKPDCIYLERGCFHDASTFMDDRFRRATKRLVLDVDDGVFLQFPEKIRYLISISDHIVVSNQNIYDYVKQYHDHITEIPTSVSVERFSRRDRTKVNERKGPTIGWMGTTSNMAFLAVCADALSELAAKREFELLIVGPTDEPLKSINLSRVNIRFVRWDADTEVDRLHEMDIGIMPLPDNQDWMKYKAATKLVQYMATGIPAVASPIGVNADILRDNRVGFAASDTREWYNALNQLLDDQQLRHAMGDAGRALAERRFSIEANTVRLAEALTGTAVD
jgi:glycosyltransferase involved in cell wall biosynthesis